MARITRVRRERERWQLPWSCQACICLAPGFWVRNVSREDTVSFDPKHLFTVGLQTARWFRNNGLRLCCHIQLQWMKLLWANSKRLTGCLEIEAPKLDRVSGMMQRHFLAVGETPFSSLRLCSFSAEQTATCNYFWHILLVWWTKPNTCCIT